VFVTHNCFSVMFGNGAAGDGLKAQTEPGVGVSDSENGGERSILQGPLALRIAVKPSAERRTSERITGEEEREIRVRRRDAVPQVVLDECYDAEHRGPAVLAGILLDRARGGREFHVVARTRGGCRRLTPRVTQQRGVWRNRQCEDNR
jgi:hypothetical protein